MNEKHIVNVENNFLGTLKRPHVLEWSCQKSTKEDLNFIAVWVAVLPELSESEISNKVSLHFEFQL